MVRDGAGGEAMVSAASLVSSAPLRSDRLASYAEDLLNEADHLFDQELLSGSTMSGPAMRAELHRVRSQLSRARSILRERPGSAAALTMEVLAKLDELAAARYGARGMQ